MKSILLKSVVASALIVSGMYFTSCGDTAQNSDSAKIDSTVVQGGDTSHSGLEGTHDQQGSLTTDVKVDTSSGQSVHTDQNKKAPGSK